MRRRAYYNIHALAAAKLRKEKKNILVTLLLSDSDDNVEISPLGLR